MHHYHAFELNIESELYFPELLGRSDLAPPPAAYDVRIQFGDVRASGLEHALMMRPFCQANAEALWLHVPGVAYFLITQGSQIIIQPYLGVDEDSIRVFLLGSCMGALLMQRDLFLFHGNAVKVGHHCISFVGHSGAGKSTLSGAFFKRGYSILADDVCAVSAAGDVLPSFPQIKLWCDAARHLNIETQSLRNIRPGIEKFAVPLGRHFHPTALPLKVVYVLHSHNKDEFSFTPISGMHKLKPLQNNTYRASYLKGLAKDKFHFGRCGRIANQITLVSIMRPNDGFQLDTLVDLIEADLMARGLSNAGE